METGAARGAAAPRRRHGWRGRLSSTRAGSTQCSKVGGRALLRTKELLVAADIGKLRLRWAACPRPSACTLVVPRMMRRCSACRSASMSCRRASMSWSLYAIAGCYLLRWRGYTAAGQRTGTLGVTAAGGGVDSKPISSGT